MRVTLAGGAVVDLASAEDLERQAAAWQRLLRRPYVTARRLVAFVSTSASIGKAPLIEVGHPPAGAAWAAQWIRTQQVDPGTSVANVSMIGYIGSAAVGQVGNTISATGAGGDDANAFTGLLAVPSLTSVPDKTIIYPSESLYFLIAGTAGNIGASTKYGVVVAVLEFPNTPEALTWI